MRHPTLIVLLAATALLGAPSAGCGGASAQGDMPGSAENPLAERYRGTPAIRTFTGRASYYSDRLEGRSTASGEPYRRALFTAASRDLPFGTVVRVVRIDNGRRTYVRINDRGPFGDRRRILDVSRAAAEQLDMIRNGVVRIRAEVVHDP